MKKLAFAAVAAAAVALAGCGGGDKTPAKVPPESARQPVLQLLGALQGGRYAEACGLLSSDLQSDLRTEVLGGVRVHAGSLANRMKQVRAQHDRAGTCEGVMSMLAEQHSKSLTRIATAARTTPLSWLGPSYDGTASLGRDQDWVLTRHGDTWRIEIANAL